MTYKQPFSTQVSRKGFQFPLQPAQAWMAILGLMFFSVVCILAGVGKILNLVFPAGAFGVGVFLYVRYPILYIGFTWWILFLTPLVRRLADYRSGFTDPSPILLAPYLVILVTLATLWRHLPKTHRQGGLPFVLSLGGVLYGYLVGLIQNSAIASTTDLLNWLTPILFGFHLFVNWLNYPSYRQNIQRTFIWGALVTGIYGVVQYLVAPEWDRFWLINTEMLSAGTPEPFGIRVWSTMNGPGIFAVVMMAGLLLLFSSRGALRLPASVAGYLAFLLSSVRSAWLGWLVGLLTLTASFNAKLQMRLIITIMVMAIAVIPLTQIEPFSEVIYSRIETFSNLEADGSGQERRQTYQEHLNKALTNYLGNGIGSSNSDVALDSAILTTLYSLGWFGTIFYIFGLFLLLFKLFQSSQIRSDPLVSTFRAITIGVFFQIIFGSVMLGASGVVLWGFLGIGLAAHNYYSYQCNAHLEDVENSKLKGLIM